MNKQVTNLIAYIREKYSPQEHERKYKNGTETIFFKKGGKSLCYIEKRDDKYSCVIVIGETLNDKVEESNVSKKISDIFKNAKQFYDGKWIFIPIMSDSDIEDVKKLLLIKRPLKRITS